MTIQSIKLNTVLAIVFAVLLTGCISVPEAIKSDATVQQDLMQIMQSPQHYTGQQVRLGGKVVNVENQQDSTRLEIATLPLDQSARPMPDNVSLGRIYADINGFLDPVDYREHLITVLGTVAGTQQGMVGKKPYTFLLVNVTGYQRWRLVQQLMLSPPYPDPWYWGYGYGSWGWHNPFPGKLESVVTD